MINRALEALQHPEDRSDIDTRATLEFPDLSPIDQRTASLDPLHADRFFQMQLPKLNRQKSTDTLINASNSLLPPSSTIKAMDRCEALAATRDLGFIIGSLTAHGIEPEGTKPLQAALLELSEITGEVPRDTVLSYTLRNPADIRRRTFTDQPEEQIFIDSLVSGMRDIPKSIIALSKALALPVHDSRFCTQIELAKSGYSNMVTGIVEVKKNIPATVFSTELRPYFPPVKIGEKEYAAPGGAQIPIMLVDYLLWGSNLKDETYAAYFKDNIQYMPPEWKLFADKIKGSPSLIERIAGQPGAITDQGIKGIAAITDLLNTILRFRYPHIKVAQDNMNIREEGSVGSGGYTVDTLETLLRYTNLAKHTVAEFKSSSPPSLQERYSMRPKASNS